MDKLKPVKLPYALDSSGNLVHISSVANGKKCGCVCPGCKQPLVAKNHGRIKQAYFAHISEVECKTALQSTLHYLAKEIFLEEKRFKFKNSENKILVYGVTEVLLETKVSDVIPDIILNCDNKFFFVEIFVSHAIDEEKKDKIREMNISTVEYDLSKVDRDISKENLKAVLLGNPKIRWSYDADEKRIVEKQKFLFENGEKIIVTRDGIACPFAPSRWFFNWISRNIFLARLKVTNKFCEDCTFYSGKNKDGGAFCGKGFAQSQSFDYATIVGKNTVLTNTQTQLYINRFVQRANAII